MAQLAGNILAIGMTLGHPKPNYSDRDFELKEKLEALTYRIIGKDKRQRSSVEATLTDEKLTTEAKVAILELLLESVLEPTVDKRGDMTTPSGRLVLDYTRSERVYI